jgi:hypothetical protein
MSGIQTTEKPEDKKERMKLLRKLHEPTFEKLGIPDALFIPKLAYKPAGKNELYLAFFASELAKGQDIYTEFADAEYEPQDPERRLYKWRYNPNYKEEYEVLDGKGIVRYLIPTAELILVKANPPETLVEEHATGQLQLFAGSENKAPSMQETKGDLPLKEATVRDLAAILWKQPVSNKQWINEMITKALA